MARRYRPRKEFKFWLYHDLTEQVRLMEYIDYLRKTRQFAKVIRNGLRLMWTLNEGDLSVLFELFPTLKAKLDTPPPPETPPGLLEKFRQITRDEMENALLRLPATTGNQSGILQKGTTPALPSSMSGNLKTNFVIQTPTFEDDDDDDDTFVKGLIKKDTNAGNSIIDNLMRSADAMASAPIATDAPQVNAVREFKKSAGETPVH